MAKGLMKFIAAGMMLLSLSVLFTAGLCAAPISMDSLQALYGDSGSNAACLAAASCVSPSDFTYSTAPYGDLDNENSSSRNLAALATTEPVHPAAILILIGAAMIWAAGVVRYSPFFRD
jgi:hypothetical protein